MYFEYYIYHHMPRESRMENQPGLDGPVLTSTSCQDGLIRSRWQQTLSLNPSVDVHSAKNNSVDVHHLFFMSWDASWVFPMIFWDLIIPCVLGVQPLRKHQPTRAFPPLLRLPSPSIFRPNTEPGRQGRSDTTDATL